MLAVVDPAFLVGALSVFAKFSQKIHLPIFSSRSSGWARVDKKYEIYVDTLCQNTKDGYQWDGSYGLLGPHTVADPGFPRREGEERGANS